MVMPRTHYYLYAHHLGRHLPVETEQEEVTPAATNGNENRPRETHTSSEANFDTNMVIILAALLFALICALGLNSILRCALRCRLLQSRMAIGTTSSAHNTGLKRHVLQRIPVVRHGSGVDRIWDSDCPICLGEFMDGEKVRVLPKCNHGFHVSCIDTWLASHSSCPICRHSLLEQEQQWPVEPSDAAAPDTEPQGNGRQDYLT